MVRVRVSIQAPSNSRREQNNKIEYDSGYLISNYKYSS